MKPRNKRERYVQELNSRLRPLTTKQWAWLDGKFPAEGLYWKSSHRVRCLCCGNEQTEHPLLLAVDMEMEETLCEECGRILRLRRWNNHPGVEKTNACVLTTVDGWQVFRYMEATRINSKGHPTEYKHNEQYRVWVDTSGGDVVVSRPYTRSPFAITWKPDCVPMQIARHNESWTGSYCFSDMFTVNVEYLLPRPRLSSELQRRGLSVAKIQKLPPRSLYEVCCKVLSNPRAETLAKSSQWPLLRYLTSIVLIDDLHWPSLRICLRHGYEVPDVSMWSDLIRFLSRLGRDLRSPAYICPPGGLPGLSAAHDRWQRLVERKDEQEHEERNRKLYGKYNDSHARYSRLNREVSGFAVVALCCVDDLKQEGLVQHHCVGGYYDKPDSLILSIRTPEGRRMETAEVDMKHGLLVQCRGALNRPTPDHDRIEDIVRGMIPEILAIYSRKSS